MFFAYSEETFLFLFHLFGSELSLIRINVSLIRLDFCLFGDSFAYSVMDFRLFGDTFAYSDFQ